jgi:hypothetical protein
MKCLTTPQTADLPTGFFQNDTYGNRHERRRRTQAWIDPVTSGREFQQAAAGALAKK